MDSIEVTQTFFLRYFCISISNCDLIRVGFILLGQLLLFFCSVSCSSDQDEFYYMLEQLLVCIRHCCDELRQVKGSECSSVVYLHVFQYLIMAQALRYFHEDAQDGGGSYNSGERSRSSYIPTLASSTQVPGKGRASAMYVRAWIEEYSQGPGTKY